jgi:hypothetical protein
VELSFVARIVAATPVKHGVPFGQIGETLRDRAIAAVGTGCDHALGERLAMVIEKPTDEGHFLGGLVTDHALSWSVGLKRGSVRWIDLAMFDKKDLRTMDGRVVSSPNLPEVIPLAQTIAQYPPPQRVSRAQTLADRAFIRPDQRHQLLLDLVDRRGGDKDLGGRAMLLHRTCHFGRGRHEGAWMSPLPPRDLLWVLAQFLGPPLQVRAGDDSFLAEFAVPPAWSEATVRGFQVRASLSPTRMIGRTIGANIANKWLADNGIGGSVDRIGIGASRHEMYTLFGVDAVTAEGSQPLHARNLEMLALLFGQLLHPETRMLLLRILAGRDPLPGTIAMQGPHEVAPQLASLGLQTDLRWFGI